jgi:hypothetical protein
MVLQWKNKSAAAKAASKPAPAPAAKASATAAPAAPEVSYDGSPLKPASEVFSTYGKHLFTGKLADYYLKKNGSSLAMFEDPSWVADRSKADLVAAAVLNW